MIVEALVVATSVGNLVLVGFGTAAAIGVRKVAKLHAEVAAVDKERQQAQKRAANEFGRKLASGIDPVKLMGQCMDPECKEHGGKNRGE